MLGSRSARRAFADASGWRECDPLRAQGGQRSNYPFETTFQIENYPEFYLMSMIHESQVQKEIVELLKIYRIDVAPIDAGGRRSRGVMIARAKAQGIQIGKLASAKTGSAIPAGYADLEGTLAPSGRALFIEVKRPAWIGANKKVIRAAGIPSQEQLDFLFEKHRRGAFVLIAWAAKDVTVALGEMLCENRRAVAGS
jgi:hypothetical protein